MQGSYYEPIEQPSTKTVKVLKKKSGNTDTLKEPTLGRLL